jgi:uncharacterized membrane protein YkvA (DUF1232 family)
VIAATARNEAWNPVRQSSCGRRLRWPFTPRSNEGGFRCRLVTRQPGPNAGTGSGTGSGIWAEAETLAQRLAEDEQTLKQRFWQKLRALAARLPFAEDLIAAHYCAFDRQTPVHVKAALVGAIAYFVLPADVVPDVLPVIGYTDDAAMLAGAIKLVASHITPEHREAARQKLARMRGAR